MLRLSGSLSALVLVLLLSDWASANKPQRSLIRWHSNYAQAVEQAQREQKMLLIFFGEPGMKYPTKQQNTVISEPELAPALSRFVCAKLSVGATIRTAEGQSQRLLDHAAFKPMCRKPGLAILDYSDPSSPHYECLVSAYPLTAGLCIPSEQIRLILDLPAGSLAERSAAYAQRLQQHTQERVAGRPRFLDRFRRRLLAEDRRESLAGTVWHSDYARASRLAEQQGKMLLIYFQQPGDMCRHFETESLADAQVRQGLQNYVCLKLAVQAEVCIEGHRVPLLQQEAFQEMLGGPGLAIVDWASKDAPYYSSVVSEFPLMAKHWYTPERVATILDLPPATLTQRTMIYAVRVHPERPASTQGDADPYLLQEASSHSQHQAAIRLQGHHQWDTRFRRISAQLPGGLTAAEVCAESWSGERLVEAAIECVRCWRLSSGHWSAVRAYHPLYGYDMKRGANGIWYATGIFGEGVTQASRSRARSG